MIKPEYIAYLDTLTSLPGGDCLEGLAVALETTVPEVSVRINRRKGVELPEGVECVPWCNDGFYISGVRPQFTFDPAFHQGLYYVQDASSMAVGSIVGQLAARLSDVPLVYIDSCAAPGGKTTGAIDILPEGSFVLANEFDRRRAAILRENIIKWGYCEAWVSRGDTSRISALGEVADIIAADVPCSGEGMMRKDEQAAEQWSPDLVRQCAALQREIVSNVWKALKPGGYLVYSTCTFNVEENERNVRWIMDTFGAEAVDVPRAGEGIAGAIGDDLPAKRFIPGRIRGEGLFVAVLRKPGEWAASSPRQIKRIKDSMTRGLDLILADEDTHYIKGKDRIVSHRTILDSRLPREFIGKEFAASVEVDYPVAVAYLRGEAIRIDAPRGLVLLTYGGKPLGAVKNIGNRANNLYPQGWEIRSTHLPDVPPQIL